MDKSKEYKDPMKDVKMEAEYPMHPGMPMGMMPAMDYPMTQPMPCPMMGMMPAMDHMMPCPMAGSMPMGMMPAMDYPMMYPMAQPMDCPHMMHPMEHDYMMPAMDYPMPMAMAEGMPTDTKDLCYHAHMHMYQAYMHKAEAHRYKAMRCMHKDCCDR
ncbi:hypothetical protein [Thermotalea metallivorans]|uniref:Uncharacterized protein n=1 Tax=Thermotalea metallivorans TaxID=520762 RepID=A0A140L6E8_9FIRM|nr:hypothetical protein [Thermotalea metallivorans]KXG76123.1 hypothetical protein AN619_10800 [Thermotalea metallivorans]